jgi:hypothetical protein
MKITSMTITKGMKLSKNYNSIDAVISLTAELDGKEDLEKAYDMLSVKVTKRLSQNVSEQIDLLAETAKEKRF